MPSIYTSNNSNFIQLTNESNAKFHIQTDATVNTTIRPSSTSTTHYRTTTVSPKGLGPAATAVIVVCVIGFFFAICVVMIYIYRRRKSPKPSPPTIATPISPLAPPAKPRSNPRHNPAAAPRRDPQPPPPSVLHCLKPHCEQYLNGLKIPNGFFNNRHDKCFCKKCHDPSDPHSPCGRWCKQLHGWVRFGLRLSQAHQKEWQVFNNWETSYYGTSSDRLESILRNRFLPLDGDKLANGTEFNSGHPDRTHYNTSPSLVHASQPEFTSRSRFRAPDGTNYNVQLVLQCKQKPDSYTIKRNTGNFHDTEWLTSHRGAVIPFGLLVRLTK